MSSRNRAAVRLATVSGALWLLTPMPVPAPATPAPTPAPIARTERPTTPPPRRARRAPPPPSPSATEQEAAPEPLRCALPAEVAEASSGGTLHAERRWRPFGVRVQDGAAVVDGVHPDSVSVRGELKLDGYSPTSLVATRDDGVWSCTIGPLQVAAVLTGRVITRRGIDAGTVTIAGCGGFTTVDRDGGFFLEVAPEPCTLFAQRIDGMFRVRSELIDVDPSAGRDIVIDLDLPSWEAAGVGVQLREHELGMAIDRVIPGGSAEDAGLEAGDVIIAIDGEDAAQFDVDAFVDFAVGPPETEVVYTVLRDGEPQSFTMVRSPIKRPD
jgi:hypothetical protein